MTDLAKVLSKRLRQARVRTGLGPKDYAVLLDVSSRTVNRWEDGTRLPDLASLLTIAHRTGVSLPWLLYDVDEQKGRLVDA